MKKLNEGATPKMYLSKLFQVTYSIQALQVEYENDDEEDVVFFWRGKDKESTALGGGGGGVARLRAEEYIAFQQCG